MRWGSYSCASCSNPNVGCWASRYCFMLSEVTTRLPVCSSNASLATRATEPPRAATFACSCIVCGCSSLVMLVASSTRFRIEFRVGYNLYPSPIYLYGWLKSIEIRKDLTDQWKAHNVKEGVGLPHANTNTLKDCIKRI